MGSRTFVERIHDSIDFKSRNREVVQHHGKYIIKDEVEGYNALFDGKKDGLSLKNTVKLGIF